MKNAKGFRQNIYEIISASKEGNTVSLVYDIMTIVLVLLSVVLLAVNTFRIPAAVSQAINVFEIIIAVIFAVDYAARIWTAPCMFPELPEQKARVRYLFSFMSFVDILSIVPVFLIYVPRETAILKIFKLCKIIRLVKVSRYIQGMAAFGEVMQEKKKTILYSVLLLCGMVVLCSLLVYAVEKDVNPSIVNGFSGIRSGLLMVVSGGDQQLEMVTKMGQTLALIMLLLGGCILGIPITIVGDAFAKVIAVQSNEEEEEKKNAVTLLSDYNALNETEKKLFMELFAVVSQKDTEDSE